MNAPTRLAAVLAAALLLPAAAPAVIKQLIPLKDEIQSAELIFVVSVDKIAPEKPGLILTASADLKGKSPFSRMPVNLTGDAEAKREKHTDVLLKRIAPQTPIVVFAHKRGPKWLA